MAGAICRSMDVLGLEDASENERAGENAETAREPETQRNVQAGKMKALVQEEMDPELWGSLGNDVLEMIIQRLPPKNIVQSQILSRTWQSKFLSRDFQKEVNKFSSRWGLPISYHPLCLSKKGLFGYDWSSLRWKYLCSLPDVPSDLGELEAYAEKGAQLHPEMKLQLRASNCHVAGSLIFSIFTTRASVLETGHDCLYFALMPYFRSTIHIMVTNAINKTVRRLASLQMIRFWDLRWAELDLYFIVDEDVYEIVMFDQDKERGIIYATVYQSNLNSWTEIKSAEMLIDPSVELQQPGVVLRGIIYLSFSTSRYAPGPGREDIFVTYDVRKGVFETIVLLPPIRHGRLVVWRDQLMIVVADNISVHDGCVTFHLFYPVHVSISKVNLDTFQRTLVSATLLTCMMPDFVRHCNLRWNRSSLSVVVADPECIYIAINAFYSWDARQFACTDMPFIPATFGWEEIFNCRMEEDFVSNIHPDPEPAEMTKAEQDIFDYGPGRSRWLVFNVNQNRWNYFAVNACEFEHPGTECVHVRNSDLSGQAFQPGLNAFVST